ncbi:PH domain-containing protein [Arcanobacterium phocae]|uniref:PH domain-containing protein n=1 Tax=Arcanobacterium phocae TaxID=131112 RepID=UPI001C0F2680|nr:PH domain-containing protein [Arcanobacterium phocae]
MKHKNELGQTSVPAGSWRKFHKVTPLADVGSFWLALIAGGFYIVTQWIEDAFNNIGLYIELITPFRLAVGIGILLGVTLIFLGVGTIMWRYKSYAIVPSGIHYRNGVFIKQYQHVRWDRIQSVEIEQKLFARIFGFGAVKVDAAGFNEDPVELGLLRRDECERLRQEILAGLADARAGKGITAREELQASVVAPADEHHVYQLSTKRLIGSTVLTGHAWFAFAGLILAAIWQFVFGSGLSIGFLIIIIGSVVNSIQYVSRSYGTTLFVAETGLKSRHGLTKLVTRSLPPTRIHAVSIKQPLLWRRFDWWQIRVTVAGESISVAVEDGNIGALVPCANREEVMRILATIFPTLGTDNDSLLMHELLYRRGENHYVHTPPKRARWINPIAATVGGYFANVDVFAIRRGRFWRQVQLIFQDHTQSVAVLQGPLQRMLGLSSLNIHLLAGPCDGVVKNFALADMRQLLREENQLTKQARAIEVSENIDEWKARLGLTAPTQEPTRGE